MVTGDINTREKLRQSVSANCVVFENEADLPDNHVIFNGKLDKSFNDFRGKRKGVMCNQ